MNVVAGRVCSQVGRRLLADVQAFAWNVPLGDVANGTAFGALLPAIFGARYGLAAPFFRRLTDGFQAPISLGRLRRWHAPIREKFPLTSGRNAFSS